MKSFLHSYKYFLILYLVFLAGGFILWWQTEHGFLIYWWADHRTEFWTLIFGIIDRLGEEWGYILFGLILLVKRPYSSITLTIGGITISVVIQSLKIIFAQPRPLHFFGENIHNINVVEGWHILSGMNSFPSGHTAGAFTLMSIVCFYQKDKPWIQVVLITMAIIAGMARIYGVNHFLIDVLFGSLVGTFIGFLIAIAGEKWLPEKVKSFKWSFIK